MAASDEKQRTRTFEFEPHQITVADAALLLDISYKDVISLIRIGHLQAEGKRPYKINIKSLVEYKRAMPSTDGIDEEDDE